MRVCIPKTVYLLLLIVLVSYPFALAGWSTPMRISERGGDWYPQIIAQGETLHVVYNNGIGYHKTCYVRSNDGGITWSQHIALTGRDGTTDFPRILRWNNKVMALWRECFNLGNNRANIGYAISNDDGLTWSDPRYVFANNWSNIYAFAASSFDSLVNIVLMGRVGQDDAVCRVRSTSFGTSWNSWQRMFNVSQHALPDQSEGGTSTYFVWDGCIDTSLTWEIRTVYSTDGGNNWSSNMLLSERDDYPSESPAIYANSSNVVCTWMDFKYSPNFDTGDILFRRSTDYGTTWSSEQQITFNHFALRSDIVSAGDTIVIAWEDERLVGSNHGSIYATRSTDGGIIWDEPVWIDNDYNNSYNPSLAMANGHVYMVWFDWIPPDSAGLYFSRWDPEPDIIHENDLPSDISVSAYPNPFNSSTSIGYDLPKASDITLAIFDILGRKVATLVDGHQSSGHHEVIWNAGAYSSGIYFARASGGNNSSVIKLIYLK